MTELKFRAWDKKRKRMFAVTTLNASGAVSVFIDDDGLYLLPAEQIELMQYTGLKDKNGKEIYEGDIVKCYFYGRMIGIYQVIWDEDNAGLELEAIEGNPKNDNIKDTRVFAEMHLFTRVIGNIHENPELLEVK